MWITSDEAYRLVQAAAADVAAARKSVREAEAARDALLAQIVGQPDIDTGRLAHAANLTRGRIYQVSGLEHPAIRAATGIVHSELHRVLGEAGSRRISEARRIRVA